MAAYTFGSIAFSRSSSCYLNLRPSQHSAELFSSSIGVFMGRRRRRIATKLLVLSSHSSPQIIKSNRWSRHGRKPSPYYCDDDGDDFEDEHYDDVHDWLLTDQEFEKKMKSGNTTNKSQGRSKRVGSLGAEGRRKLESKSSPKNKYPRLSEELDFDGSHLEIRSSPKNKYPRLSEELDFDERWLPLLDYLSTFGLKDSHFIRIYRRHISSLRTTVSSAQERLTFLLSVGVKQRDIRKILLRQPQILEYTVESNLKSHVDFLASLGIPGSKIGKIVSAAPSLFSYSVENSLKPTVRYLLEEVGIKQSDLSKVVQLSPQILVQRIDSSWTTRLSFLTEELEAPRDNIVKMVRKHPQLLHYSIEDGLLPRIDFLRSIGMGNSDMVKVLTSNSQVFSLSLEDNLMPKYMYLINELRNEVQSLTKYPTYLSLSLDQRIRPRHRFLVSLKKAPKGPFPLSSLIPTDESFCQWAGTSVDTYLAFRQRFLLKEFANK